MPVKEITVFKDGHAFVLHEGQVPTDAGGDVVLDYLPRPVLGTFWAYSANPGAKLSAVVSSKRIVSVDRTALTIRELIEGNVGARVRIREENQPQVYEATILRVPERTSEELGRTSAPGTEDRLPERGDIVLLKAAEGVRAVPIGRIQEVTFLDEPRPGVPHEEFRNIMTLKLDWNRRKPEEAAQVGMVYVQRGIRWIPNYRIEIDGKGEAVIRLQATLINELADIQDVKAHLVIGVPTFAFKDSVDPISLQETVARLSSHFREDSQTAFAFSNAIMSQSREWREADRRRGAGRSDVIDLGPEVTGSLKNEDLYVFTIEHVTLKKGQRMVLPVTEFKLKYSDVFALDLPFGPPPELRHRFNNEQQAQLARLFHAPKVMHKIRLQNNSDYPLTTAPALILREGRLIAQGMMTYTAVNASTDLDLTVAVDIAVEKVDKETAFTPDAEKWNGHRYGRRDLTGKIQLTNRRAETVYLEVRRSVLGHIDSASYEGRIEHLDRHEGGWMITDGAPFWWNWCNWPHWWYYFNSVGRATWKFELEPGKSADLEYNWHYFWRQ
ncbi:MAG: hypothetical protein ACYS76_01790 [Planctomycetota bacterium]